MIAGLGVLLGLAALASTRRLSRKLDALTQSYWELRYDYTRLRSQVARLDPETREPIDSAQDKGASAQPPSVSFVPLSAIRKKP